MELGEGCNRVGRLEGGFPVFGVEPDAIELDIKRSLNVTGEGVADHHALPFVGSGRPEHPFKEPGVGFRNSDLGGDEDVVEEALEVRGFQSSPLDSADSIGCKVEAVSLILQKGEQGEGFRVENRLAAEVVFVHLACRFHIKAKVALFLEEGKPLQGELIDRQQPLFELLPAGMVAPGIEQVRGVINGNPQLPGHPGECPPLGFPEIHQCPVEVKKKMVVHGLTPLLADC